MKGSTTKIKEEDTDYYVLFGGVGGGGVEGKIRAPDLQRGFRFEPSTDE